MGRCVQGIDVRILEAESSGDNAAIYPQIVRIGKPIKFQVNYLLVGLQLSSSLIIFGANKGGIGIVIGQKKTRLTISEGLQSPIFHVSGPNSISGPPAIVIPTSKVTPVSFGSYGIPIPSGTEVALYAFGDATAGNDFFAVCSLQLIQYLF